MGRWKTGLSIWLLTVCLPFSSTPAYGVSTGQAGNLKLKLVEVAETVDLSRGRERFLTVTIDLFVEKPAELRRVQPLRDDFQLLAGTKALPCRWLRGGTLPEDASRLRFTLGFSRPPSGTRSISLKAKLPILESADFLELALHKLTLGVQDQSRTGAGWALTVASLEVREYTPPALPEKGQYTVKSIPADTRVFRKEGPEGAPVTAVVLSVSSQDATLYDPTLDVSGWLTVDQAPPAPLLSALMRRVPSRATNSTIRPFITAQFYFAPPKRGTISGAVLRLHRRAANPVTKTVIIRNLPLPKP